jgi:hypothetical protein
LGGGTCVSGGWMPPGMAPAQVKPSSETQSYSGNFAVEVDFEELGVADLKLWSGPVILAPAQPLALCR